MSSFCASAEVSGLVSASTRRKSYSRRCSRDGTQRGELGNVDGDQAGLSDSLCEWNRESALGRGERRKGKELTAVGGEYHDGRSDRLDLGDRKESEDLAADCSCDDSCEKGQAPRSALPLASPKTPFLLIQIASDCTSSLSYLRSPERRTHRLPVATPPTLVRETVTGSAVMTLVKVCTSPLAAVLSLV